MAKGEVRVVEEVGSTSTVVEAAVALGSEKSQYRLVQRCMTQCRRSRENVLGNYPGKTYNIILKAPVKTSYLMKPRQCACNRFANTLSPRLRAYSTCYGEEMWMTDDPELQPTLRTLMQLRWSLHAGNSGSRVRI